MCDPEQLRQQMRTRRRGLSARQQRAHSQQVAARLARSAPFLRSRRIAFYRSADGEIDLAPLLCLAHRMGKACFLPVIRNGPEHRLWFCRYRPGDRLIPNRFGIDEPDWRTHPPVTPWGLNLILMPLVAFDAGCHRLGMGGGYYDRTLGFLHRRHRWRSPHLIGVAHDCQQAERLPVRHWDIPLQGVVTERCFYPGH